MLAATLMLTARAAEAQWAPAPAPTPDAAAASTANPLAPARAQGAAVPGMATSDEVDVATGRKLLEQGRRMRIAGFTLIGVGAALAILSVTAFARPDDFGGAPRGLAFAMSGVFAGGGGGYLVFEGNERRRRGLALGGGGQLVLSPAPAGTLGASVGLTY
jgi:hypothetical protein